MDDDLGCASYLIGDEHAGDAVLVDPAYAVEPYIEEAERRGLRLTGVLETQTHADHVSGHGRLALEVGLPVHVHEAAEATYPHEQLGDGSEVELGDVVMRTVHTPGHRPEHCAFAVIDHARGEEPCLVLTAAVGAQHPHAPNTERIVELNRGPFVPAQPPLNQVSDAGDAVVLDVRPQPAFADGHRPGAVNVPISGSSFATRAAFVLPERPVLLHARGADEAHRAARSLHAVGIFNLVGWQSGGGTERLEPVTVDELEHMLASGEIEVLDVREADERDAGFIPGTDHMPYRNMRQAAENGLIGGRQVVTICESGERAAVAASVLRAAGVDARPVLGGGIAEWRMRGGEMASFRRCGGHS